MIFKITSRASSQLQILCKLEISVVGEISRLGLTWQQQHTCRDRQNILRHYVGLRGPQNENILKTQLRRCFYNLCTFPKAYIVYERNLNILESVFSQWQQINKNKDDGIDGYLPKTLFSIGSWGLTDWRAGGLFCEMRSLGPEPKVRISWWNLHFTYCTFASCVAVMESNVSTPAVINQSIILT